MAGTKEDGKKAAATNKAKYGDNFYASIGAKGGKAQVSKGFSCMSYEKRSAAGRKGGKISKRGCAKNRPGKKVYVRHRIAHKQSVEVQHD